jgi:hypothetical protein
MDIGATSLICTWTSCIVTEHKHNFPEAVYFLQVRKDLMYSAYCGDLVESVSDKKPKNRMIKKSSDNKPVCMTYILNVRKT